MTLPFQLHFHPHSSFDHYSSQTSQFPHLASQSPGKESPGSLQSGGGTSPHPYLWPDRTGRDGSHSGAKVVHRSQKEIAIKRRQRNDLDDLLTKIK